MVAGLIGKFAAALALCPDPVIGGFNIVCLGMISAVGFSCLQFCDMRSVRNLVILGSSFMLGLMVPQYMYANPGVIDTGRPNCVLHHVPFYIKLCLSCSVVDT